MPWLGKLTKESIFNLGLRFPERLSPDHNGEGIITDASAVAENLQPIHWHKGWQGLLKLQSPPPMTHVFQQGHTSRFFPNSSPNWDNQNIWVSQGHSHSNHQNAAVVVCGDNKEKLSFILMQQSWMMTVNYVRVGDVKISTLNSPSRLPTWCPMLSLCISKCPVAYVWFSLAFLLHLSFSTFSPSVLLTKLLLAVITTKPSPISPSSSSR